MIKEKVNALLNLNKKQPNEIYKCVILLSNYFDHKIIYIIVLLI